MRRRLAPRPENSTLPCGSGKRLTLVLPLGDAVRGPCKQEMPGYQKLLDRYGSQGLVIIGLKSYAMADTENPLKFARKIGVHYQLAVATEAVTWKFGGIEGLPTTLLYDRNGVLRKKVIGFEYTNVLESELKALL